MTKSIIQGLQNDNAGKLVTLDNLIKRTPNSEFADNALLELGSTYLQLGDLAKAQVPLKKLVRDYASTSDLVNSAYLKLGLIAYNQDNGDEVFNVIGDFKEIEDNETVNFFESYFCV